jgi:hypothetical protein
MPRCTQKRKKMLGFGHVLALDMKRLRLCICFSGLALWGQKERELMRKAVQDFVDHQARLGDFLFTVKGHNKEFSGDGKVKSESRWVRERRKYGEFRITAPVERNGKPLWEADRASGEKDIDRILGELNAQSPEVREKAKRERIANARKEDPWIQEMPDALNLKLVGEEKWNGRATSNYEANPNPGYKPNDMQARVFERCAARSGSTNWKRSLCEPKSRSLIP